MTVKSRKIGSIWLILLAMLMFTSFFYGYAQEKYSVYTENGREAEIAKASVIAMPCLPLEKPETEKITAVVQNQSGKTGRVSSLRVLVIFVAAVYLSLLRLRPAGRYRRVISEEADQLQKSIIAYIHHQEDQK